MPSPTRPLVAALALALVAAACGGSDDPSSDAAAGTVGSTDEPVTITFEAYSYGVDGAPGEGMQQLLDEFEDANPNITVEPISTPAGEIHTSIQLQAASGEAPDVAQVGWSKLAFLVENLPYVPVEELAPDDEWADHIAGFTPEVLAIGEHDGAVAGMPFTVSIPTVLYNADLFREAGLDPEDPPATWEEAQAAATAITEATDAEGIYVAVVDPAKSDYLTQSLVYSNGGELITDDGEVSIDEPEAVEALSMVQELSSSGAQPRVPTADALALMEAGDLGMLVVSTSVLGKTAAAAEGSYELRTAPMPSFGDEPAQPTSSGAGLFVFTDDPQRQAAAWKLIQFLTGDRGMTIVTSKIGYLPLRPALLEDQEHLAPFVAEDPRILAAVEQLDDLHPYADLPGPDGARAREVLQDAVEAIVLGNADPESTLADAADRMRSLLP